ncbi:MAG: hypothetical protein RBT19_09955 [Tenuifilaceae bacterium]|jgi:hypothetical protein|nr:hypothetical protein [Tenuifilaceae bacterium]
MRTRILIIVTIIFALASCNQGGERRRNQQQEYKEVDLSKQGDASKIFYRFPAPKDIIDYIKTDQLIYLKDFLNPISNADKYHDSRVQNFNLGVYAADFAYITVFKTLSEASEYFGTIEKLAYQAGLSSIFDEQMRRRVEANEANIDSLGAIARNSYNDMVNYLTLTGNERQLAIISAGGYVEVLYLAINQTDDLEADYSLLRKIYDQRYGLENLCNFMSDFTDDQWMSNLYHDLQAILNVFNLVDAKVETESKATKGKGGELNFSGGNIQLSITPENYAKLKRVVVETRGKYTSPS